MQQLEQDTNSLKLKPLVIYPSEAQIGKEYLMTIDVELADPQAEWPYPDEEYGILFQLDLHPYFSYQALSKSEPMIVLHRFGGTYGPAEFLLTANTKEVQQGEISITLLNTAGLPIAHLELPCEIKENIQAEHTRISVKQPAMKENSITQSPEGQKNDEHRKAIIQHLTQSGWTVTEIKGIRDNQKSNDALLDFMQAQHMRFPYIAVSGSPWLPNGYILSINNTPRGLIIVCEENTRPGTIEIKELTPMLHAFFNFDSEQLQTVRPFLYEAIGSEIYFYNYLEPSMLTNRNILDFRGRRIFTFHRPETLVAWSNYTLSKSYFPQQNSLFRFTINNMPPLKRDGLLDFQFQAIQNIERSLQSNQTRVLAQIDVGYGQTHTTISSIYRWLSIGNAKHILYLVNSDSSINYTMQSVHNFTVSEETGGKFTDYYNVATIAGKNLDPDVHVYITTIKDFYTLFSARINQMLPTTAVDPDSTIVYNPKIPIEYFDAIVLTESEQFDYEKWQHFLNYFDTFFIGIATDISGTMLDFFQQNLVYTSTRTLDTTQRLSTIIKSVRDLLRKDAGLSGDTDRLPQLIWLLFLKCIDDFEQAQAAIYGEDKYSYMLAEKYRWRTWVVGEKVKDRKTGDELIKFVENELFPYLKTLSGKDVRDLRTIIGTIFTGTHNRIRSGYIMREVVDKLNDINFNSTEEIDVISHFYETMLREVRDASRDSGEFYTPRPIVRFIVDRLKPQPGERILDPSCGTAGFLIEVYNQLQESGKISTVSARAQLESNLIGYEKKSMPYLLAIMNMMIHGIEKPNIIEQNTLALNIRQISKEDRVDIIATNPPFGGEEEEGIIKNFPQSMRTSETALLFFQYIMAMLKRPNGRCGVVLPNGFLFSGGVGATIKKELLQHFNLHTIVRLPVGAFAPYTSIPTNILFFEACAQRENIGDEQLCTREIWYYEISLPEGRNSYTKTKPMPFEDFANCIAWWENRVENEHAWKVPVEEIIRNDYNLDSKHKSPETSLVKSLDRAIVRDEHNLLITKSIRDFLKQEEQDLIEIPFIQTPEEILYSLISTYCLNALQNIGTPEQELRDISKLHIGFRAPTTSTSAGPLFIRTVDIKEGNIRWPQVIHRACQTPSKYELHSNDILIVRSGAGSLGRSILIKEVPEQAIFSDSLVRLHLAHDISPEYIYWCLQSQQFWQQIMRTQMGTTRHSITMNAISRLQFPMPSWETQSTLVTYLNNFRNLAQNEKYLDTDMQTFLQQVKNFITRSAEV